MKALPSFGRNDVIRAIALVSVVAFPLIAAAQLGPSRAVKLSKDVSPVAGAAPAAAIASRESCADQHWPFFSNACLRGSSEAIEARVVSMTTESPPASAASDESPKRVQAADTAQSNAPIAKPKKPAKPRVATHMRERSLVASYAVNSNPGGVTLAGW